MNLLTNDLANIVAEYVGLNANLLLIKEGSVSWAYKGTADECNNSILATYGLHEQSYPNPIEIGVSRLCGLKMLRTIRGLLSYLSRTEYRVEVKKALSSGDLDNKLAVLSGVDLLKIKDFEKSSIIETYKFLAFQMGQTKALLKDGVELFTKNSVASYYPELFPYLARQDSSAEALSVFYGDFVNMLKSEYKKVYKQELYVTNFHGVKEVLDAKKELVKPPVVVFDMDGTLFDESHRRSFYESGDHDKYFDMCHLDAPIQHVIDLTHEYRANGYEIWLMTGRCISCEDKTIQSLKEHNVDYDFIKMRGLDNRLPDYVLKPAWIPKYIGLDRVVAIYDDSDAVIEGFRNKGLNVIDVKTLSGFKSTLTSSRVNPLH